MMHAWCVISVTKENVRSSWLYFEAGRIAGNGEHVHICPFLVGVGPSSLTSTPLAQYQCTEATKEDTLRLVKSLNKALDESKRHHEEMLTANFESKWPEFEAELGRIMAAEGGVSAGEVDPEPGEGTHQPAAIAYTDGLSGDELYRLAVAVKENTQTVTTGRNDSVAAMLASKGFYQRVPFEPTTRIADIPYTIPLDVWRYLQEHEKELLAKTIESNSKREDRIGRLTGQ